MESITLLIVLYKVFAIGICSMRFSILENNNFPKKLDTIKPKTKTNAIVNINPNTQLA